MSSNRYCLKNVLDKHFNIPLYQRLFAWTDIQVNKLLHDLKEYFSSSDFLNSEDEHKAYYLGLLTAVRKGDDHLDLIDGQQRFTVMMLLGVSFRKFGPWNEFLDGGNRLKLAARSEDEVYLRQLSTIDDLEKYLDDPSPSFTYENAYMKNALKCIRRFMDDNFTDDDSKKGFAMNVYNHLTFFISELPSHYLADPMSLNKYFEVMNSTGKGLEQHEILKVKLLKKQADSPGLLSIWNTVSQMDRPIIAWKENDTDESYAERYRCAIQCCRNEAYEDAFRYTRHSAQELEYKQCTIDVLPVKKKEHTRDIYVEDKEDSIITFPEFLLFSLDIYSGLEGHYSFYQTDKLLDRYEMNPLNDCDVPDFYNKMLFYRLLLDYYVIRRDVSNGQYSFTINLKDRAGDRETRDCVRQYLSMLTVSTEFYIWLKPYFKHLLEKDHTTAEILNLLKEDDNARRNIGDEEDKYPRSLRKLKYQDNIDRYWFWRLDYYLWERRNDYFDAEDAEIVKEYVFRVNRSIEHLHPQNEEYNEKWKHEITNCFGNLAMISQSFNSTQHHDNIRLKFARIQEQLDNKALQSLKMLAMYRSAADEHSKWTQELALENLEKMCDLLEKTSTL